MKIKNLKYLNNCLSQSSELGYTLLATPHFYSGMPSCLPLVSLVQSWFLKNLDKSCGSLWLSWRNKATLNISGRDPSLIEWKYFCIKVDDNRSLKNLTWSSVFSQLSNGIYELRCLSLLPNACDPVDIHSHYTLLEVFTHLQWTIWQMSTGEVIASHWSTPVKSCWPDGGWSLDHYLLVA